MGKIGWLGCAGRVRKAGRGGQSAGVLAPLILFAAFAPIACGAEARDRADPAAAQLLACKAIAEDAARLRCFDAMAAAVPTPSPAGDVIRLDEAPEPARTAASGQHSGIRHSVRIEVGYGYAIGDYSGSSEVARHGTLISQSGTGGAGGGLLAEAWLDDWPLKNFSTGLGYVETDNGATIAAKLPQGVSILTDPINAEISATAHAKILMINLAYRPRGFGRIRPIVGFGLGGGYGEITGLEALQNAFIGNGAYRQEAHSGLPAMQVYTGVEADLTDRLYVDLTPRLLWIGAAPFGNGLHYTNFILGANVGYRFR
jgi:hypothetical protein